jgi:hypothetical protein
MQNCAYASLIFESGRGGTANLLDLSFEIKHPLGGQLDQVVHHTHGLP